MSKYHLILSRLNKTVDNVNHSLEVITKDVDSLSIEVEGLLNKANVLVDVSEQLKNDKSVVYSGRRFRCDVISDVNTSFS